MSIMFTMIALLFAMMASLLGLVRMWQAAVPMLGVAVCAAMLAASCR
jgi:hypothetical protein